MSNGFWAESETAKRIYRDMMRWMTRHGSRQFPPRWHVSDEDWCRLVSDFCLDPRKPRQLTIAGVPIIQPIMTIPIWNGTNFRQMLAQPAADPDIPSITRDIARNSWVR